MLKGLGKGAGGLGAVFFWKAPGEGRLMVLNQNFHMGGRITGDMEVFSKEFGSRSTLLPGEKTVPCGGFVGRLLTADPPGNF